MFVVQWPRPCCTSPFCRRKTHTVWLVEEVTPGRPDANFGEKTFLLSQSPQWLSDHHDVLCRVKCKGERIKKSVRDPP